MFTPAATAARTASEPEWWKVPSPMFWTRWRSSVNGAMPIHWAPSPPIWVMPVISPLPSGFSSTIVWQPMPPPTSVPSGALVELLCGQPEQKNGERVGHGQRPRATGDLVELARGGRPRTAAPAGALRRAATARATRSASRSRVGGKKRRAALVALAHDPGSVRHAVEGVLQVRLDERALLLGHQDLVEPAGEVPHDAGLERPDHPQLEQADPGALQRALVEAQAAEARGRRS